MIELYSDLACPFAYVAHARWRRLRDDYAGRVAIVHRCLALEYVNREPAPMALVEAEIAELAKHEPDLPYQPWPGAPSTWPVTIWPAFEAVKCAERQGLSQADDLAWAIRVAFFGQGQCISMRHVLLELSGSVGGLDPAQFEADFDRGVAKQLVINESRQGWDELRVPGSPTFVLPSGRHIAAPGLPDLDIDPSTGRIRQVTMPQCSPPCLDVYRAFLDEACQGM